MRQNENNEKRNRQENQQAQNRQRANNNASNLTNDLQGASARGFNSREDIEFGTYFDPARQRTTSSRQNAASQTGRNNNTSNANTKSTNLNNNSVEFANQNEFDDGCLRESRRRDDKENKK